MPKVRRSRKPPPDGWELIEPTIDELDQKMREGRSNCFRLMVINIIYCNLQFWLLLPANDWDWTVLPIEILSEDQNDPCQQKSKGQTA